MLSSAIRLAWLATLVAFSWPAQAQFKVAPTPMPVTPAIPTPMPMVTPMPSPTLPVTPVLPIAPSPTFGVPNVAVPEVSVLPTTVPPVTTVPPGCPGGPECPTEGEGALSEAAREILEELAKCEVEGKSVEQCLSDDPPPPLLSQLSGDNLSRLTSCIGHDLSSSRDRWAACAAGVH